MAIPSNLPRSTPEEQGISSAAILEFVHAIEQNVQHLHSFMLLRHGSVVAESWFHPYRATTPHMLYSLSKSFTSTAVGMAVSEERLAVNEPLLKFFPEDAPKKISNDLADMQVHHLLSMSTGHQEDTIDRILRRKNPFKAFLALPLEHVPGTYFSYNNGATFMLAAIVQKLTGQTLIEYLTPRLFEPLGIEDASWETHPNGMNLGWMGLNIKTEDIARFGQLYLQKGLWNDHQLLPTAWIKVATSSQISTIPNTNPNPNSDWEQGYGYQFWMCKPTGLYRGDGAFGQNCIVMPEQDAVLAITAGIPDMQLPLTIAWETLLPAMVPHVLAPDHVTAQSLAERLCEIKLAPPHGTSSSPQAPCYSEKVFGFEPNPETLHSLSFNFDTNTFTYRLLGGGERRGKHTLPFGSEKWVEGLSALGLPGLSKVVSSGTWTTEDTFVLTMCHYETPFITTITCRFLENQVFLDSKPNVSFDSTERPQLLGKIE